MNILDHIKEFIDILESKFKTSTLKKQEYNR